MSDKDAAEHLTADERGLLEAMKKATPLPWTVMDPLPPSYEDHGWRSLAAVGRKRINVSRERLPFDHEANAAYIAAAANAVPGLLDTIARLRGEVERLTIDRRSGWYGTVTTEHAHQVAVEIPDLNERLGRAEAERDALLRRAQAAEEDRQSAEADRDALREGGDLLDRLAVANLQRCERDFHHRIMSWSVLEWTGAMAGEAGEAANLAKKITRGDYAETDEIERKGVRQSAAEHLADEIADTVIYGDLICTRVGVSLADAIVRKFNATSDERGSKVTLARAPLSSSPASEPPTTDAANAVPGLLDTRLRGEVERQQTEAIRALRAAGLDAGATLARAERAEAERDALRERWDAEVETRLARSEAISEDDLARMHAEIDALDGPKEHVCVCPRCGVTLTVPCAGEIVADVKVGGVSWERCDERRS